MRILGIDPGTRVTGYGVIDEKEGEIRYVDCGVIRVEKRGELKERLKSLYESLSKVISHHSPDVIALEDIYFHKNLKSAIALAYARGMVLLAAAFHKREVFEYSPAFVRKAVVGYGGADKEQVRDFIRKSLHIEEELHLDSCDALCVAVCHATSYRGMQTLRGK